MLSYYPEMPEKGEQHQTNFVIEKKLSLIAALDALPVVIERVAVLLCQQLKSNYKSRMQILHEGKVDHIYTLLLQ